MQMKSLAASGLCRVLCDAETGKVDLQTVMMDTSKLVCFKGVHLVSTLAVANVRRSSCEWPVRVA